MINILGRVHTRQALYIFVYYFLMNSQFTNAQERLPNGPITQHFENWLNRNGYSSDNYARHDLGTTGSYGGKQNSSQKVRYVPVMFIHGNTDGALKVPGAYSSGSSYQIAYFESRGYSSAELYVTTWGNRLLDEAKYQGHNCSTISRLRRFAHAIMEYTEVPMINIISHSMGVTLARKLVKGGMLREKTGVVCDIGPPLTAQVGLFLGIAGANYGMCDCISPMYTCNDINGLTPGAVCGPYNASYCGFKEMPSNCVPKYSKLLYDMNEDGIREGKHVVTFWTRSDELIMVKDIVWGEISSIFPTMDAQYVFENYTHMQTKELTTQLQYELLTNMTSLPQNTNSSSPVETIFALTIFLGAVRYVVHSL